MKRLKSLVKKILPGKIVDNIKKERKQKFYNNNLKTAFEYDLKRYFKFGYSNLKRKINEPNLISLIIKDYHSIEKGLTMPDFRPGFGKLKIKNLVENCLDYISNYNETNIQLIHALAVLQEYKSFHEKLNYSLDNDILRLFDLLDSNKKGIPQSNQILMTKKNYLKYTQGNFVDFSNSRKSVRDFGNDDVSIDKIINSIEICRNTPSACNRQAWRTHVYSEKTTIDAILKIQDGATGFAHLTNKLIVVTCEIGLFGNVIERYQAYIDGGMFAMNLLYALHYNQIAACILNCSNSPEKDRKFIEVCKTPESEVFIAMIACGSIKDNFNIAFSKRYNLNDINTIHS